MHSLVVGNVMKFQHPSSNHFGDIAEIPEGWMKTTPPLPLIGLTTTFACPDAYARPIIAHSDARTANASRQRYTLTCKIAQAISKIIHLSVYPTTALGPLRICIDVLYTVVEPNVH